MSRRISPALAAKPVRFGKQVGVEQADEMGEAVVVAVVRRGREQKDVVGGLAVRCSASWYRLVFATSSPRPDELLV